MFFYYLGLVFCSLECSFIFSCLFVLVIGLGIGVFMMMIIVLYVMDGDFFFGCSSILYFLYLNLLFFDYYSNFYLFDLSDSFIWFDVMVLIDVNRVEC